MAQPTIELPNMPDNWLDDPASAPASGVTKRPPPPGDSPAPGILGGLPTPPDWSLENSSINAFVDPETMKTIDFTGDAPPETPPWLASNGTTQANPVAQYVPDFQHMQLPDVLPSPVTGSSPGSMTPSDNAKSFMKSWEQGPDGGPALSAYPSPEGGADTIGWGHKIMPGEDFSGGISASQADQIFSKDLTTAENRVQQTVHVPLSQQQYDALVSLDYNTPGALGPKSTLLDELNNYDYAGTGDQMFRWNMGGVPKQVIPGLADRRAGEWNMFVSGVYTNHK